MNSNGFHNTIMICGLARFIHFHYLISEVDEGLEKL